MAEEKNGLPQSLCAMHNSSSSSDRSKTEENAPATQDTVQSVQPVQHAETETQPQPQSSSKLRRFFQFFRVGEPELTRERAARTDGKRVLQEEDVYDQLGFSFPWYKKWRILSIIFLVQVSMNFNTSLYSNAIPGISKEFSVTDQTARWGAAVFLLTYAFGCELWAPWSEEFGRFWVLQISLLCVNMFQIPVAVANNFTTILVGRALGGLSSAGGSVTLGMVADMWEPEAQQYAVAFVVFSSVAGSVLGPVIGGFTQTYLNWTWSIWIQLIFGFFVQSVHYIWVEETRTTVMLDKIAIKSRRTAQKQKDSGSVNFNEEDLNLYGPNEVESLKVRLSPHEFRVTWTRPFLMFLTEPIVLVLSLLSGFSDALIFMFIQSYGLVYAQWKFSDIDVGLAFIPILLGYFGAWGMFAFAFDRNIKEREAHPEDDKKQFESRLKALLWTAPLLPIGLLGFAFTCTGPPIHWIGSFFFAALVGVANYAIYMATIDYMITAYGPYSASATGGNGWSRDFLAGALTVPAVPFFSNIGKNNLLNASIILFGISCVLVGAVYIIYWKGPILRARSPFAQKLHHARETHHPTTGQSIGLTNAAGASLTVNEEDKEEDATTPLTPSSPPQARQRPSGRRQHSYTRSQQDLSVHRALGSKVRTPGATTPNSTHARSIGQSANDIEMTSRGGSPERSANASGAVSPRVVTAPTSGAATPKQASGDASANDAGSGTVSPGTGVKHDGPAAINSRHAHHAAELGRRISLIAEKPEERDGSFKGKSK